MPRPTKAETTDDATGAAAPSAPAPAPTVKPKAPEEPAASSAASPSTGKAATPEPPQDPVAKPKGFSIGIPGFRFHGSSPIPDLFRSKPKGPE